MKKSFISLKLIIMNFLQFGIWGAYLTSMGSFLAGAGLGSQIWLFFATQGFVSIFMPALAGIVADKWIPAQKVLSLCHALAAVFMLAAGWYAAQAGANLEFGVFYALYALSVAFYMPTIAISNSVAYNALEVNGKDPVKDFPPIRVFGTVGFIISMLAVNFISIGGVQMQDSYTQLILSGVLSLVLCLYSLTLPQCPVGGAKAERSIRDAFGLSAFSLFKVRHMATFFMFCILMGTALQITNGYANTFLGSFSSNPAYADTFAVRNSNALLSLSQIFETLCFLLVPLCMKRLGIKKVLLMSMTAWVLRFGLFGLGTPDMPGVLLFVLSCILYGVAFDFYNIAGSRYVEQNVDKSMRASAQGLFMMMSNGIGATLGLICAGAVMDKFVFKAVAPDWSKAWFIFAGYMVVVTVLFSIFFKESKSKKNS